MTIASLSPFKSHNPKIIGIDLASSHAHTCTLHRLSSKLKLGSKAQLHLVIIEFGIFCRKKIKVCTSEVCNQCPFKETYFSQIISGLTVPTTRGDERSKSPRIIKWCEKCPRDGSSAVIMLALRIGSSPD